MVTYALSSRHVQAFSWLAVLALMGVPATSRQISVSFAQASVPAGLVSLPRIAFITAGGTIAMVKGPDGTLHPATVGQEAKIDDEHGRTAERERICPAESSLMNALRTSTEWS